MLENGRTSCPGASSARPAETPRRRPRALQAGMADAGRGGGGRSRRFEAANAGWPHASRDGADLRAERRVAIASEPEPLGGVDTDGGVSHGDAILTNSWEVRSGGFGVWSARWPAGSGAGASSRLDRGLSRPSLGERIAVTVGLGAKFGAHGCWARADVVPWSAVGRRRWCLSMAAGSRRSSVVGWTAAPAGVRRARNGTTRRAAPW